MSSTLTVIVEPMLPDAASFTAIGAEFGATVVVVVVGGGAVVVVVVVGGGAVVVVVVVVGGGAVVVVVVVVEVVVVVVVVEVVVVVGGGVVDVAGGRVVVVVVVVEGAARTVVVGGGTSTGAWLTEIGPTNPAATAVATAILPLATDPIHSAARWKPATNGTCASTVSGPITLRKRLAEILRKARTTTGSNWLPAFSLSSRSANRGLNAAWYERRAVIASKASATATMRAPKAISLPASRSG